MKKLCFLTVLLSLLGSSVFAVTIGTWVGPTGSWSDGTKWSTTPNIPPAPSTSSDEIKITNNATVCTVDSDIPDYLCRLSVTSGPAGATLVIAAGGDLFIGDVIRIGSASSTSNGGVGYANQTGGTLTTKDLILGHYGTNTTATAKGYYTMSGGLLTYTSADGRLYVGGGNGNGYNEGTFTVVGTDPNIQMKGLYVGSDETNYGTGTLEYQVAPAGVSPITIIGGGRVSLDFRGATSTARLVVSASGSTPGEDIPLVHVTSVQPTTGTFDTLNGGPAAEGTEVVVGDNIYSLTYSADLDGSSVANDIVLIHLMSIYERAHTPNPADDSTKKTSQSSLSWMIPDPNIPSTPIHCDVYFGKDPNRPQMKKVTLGDGVSTVALDSTNFPGFVPLTDKTMYYWVVDCHDSSNNPTVITGTMWNFYVDDNEAPDPNAGPDQVTWGLPKVINLDGTVTDDGLPTPPALTYLWERTAGPVTADANSLPDPNNTVDTSVTITQRGVYEYKLTADDGDKQASDTVQIIVGTNPCDASHLSTGDPYDAGDQNQDCIVNLEDFAVLIAKNWLDCSDTRTNCGN